MGITVNKKELWDKTTEAFKEYIEELKGINLYVYNPNTRSGDVLELLGSMKIIKIVDKNRLIISVVRKSF